MECCIGRTFGTKSTTKCVHLLTPEGVPCNYLAIGPGIVGHTGLNTVLKYLAPLVISLSTVTEPLIGSLIGAR